MQKIIAYFLSISALILFVLCEFLPVYSRSSYSDIETVRYSYGRSADIWPYIFVPTVILFVLGLFGQKLAVKIIFYSLLVVTVAFHILINIVFRSPHNAPYTEQLEIGYYIAFLGLLSIAAATIISLHRPDIKKRNTRTDLLDS